MNLTLAIALALQWAREQAQNEVFAAFFFRFRAGGFALGVCPTNSLANAGHHGGRLF